MSTMQDITNPEERQRALDRMKRRATGLLVLMGASTGRDGDSTTAPACPCPASAPGPGT